MASDELDCHLWKLMSFWMSQAVHNGGLRHVPCFVHLPHSSSKRVSGLCCRRPGRSAIIPAHPAPCATNRESCRASNPSTINNWKRKKWLDGTASFTCCNGCMTEKYRACGPPEYLETPAPNYACPMAAHREANQHPTQLWNHKLDQQRWSRDQPNNDLVVYGGERTEDHAGPLLGMTWHYWRFLGNQITR